MTATIFRLLSLRETVSRPPNTNAMPELQEPSTHGEARNTELVIPDLRQRAEALHVHRRMLKTTFRDHVDLFLNPAWDMMLDLFRQGGVQPQPTATLFADVGVAESTAKRWLKVLEKRGLVVSGSVRFADATIATVALTENAAALIQEFLEEV